MKPKAIGFLDRTISNANQDKHENAIRTTARHKHIDLARTFAASQLVQNPIHRLTVMLGRTDADTIIVPALHHLDGRADELNETYTIIVCPTAVGEDPIVYEPHALMAAAR